MTQVSRELAAEGLKRAEIELRHGDLSVRTAGPGETGHLESDSTLEISDGGEVLFVRQPHFSRGDVELLLPASVQEFRCQTGHGDVVIAGGHGRLEAKTGNGDVHVSGWDGPAGLATGKGDVEAEDLWGGLRATTGEGDVTISRSGGFIEARTGNGDISVSEVSGEINVSTGQGDIDGNDLKGAQVDAHTGQGDVELHGVLSGLRIRTGQGDIVCQCAFREGSHEIRTSQGDIEIGLPGGAGIRIDAATSHGHIETDLPLVKVGTTGPQGYFSRRLVGSIGSGETIPSISLRTNHGDIRLFAVDGLAADVAAVDERHISSRPAHPAPLSGEGAQNAAKPPEGEVHVATDAPAVGAQATSQGSTPGDVEQPRSAPAQEPPNVSEDALAVLEALSRGDISVDEALLLVQRMRPRGGAGSSNPS